VCAVEQHALAGRIRIRGEVSEIADERILPARDRTHYILSIAHARKTPSGATVVARSVVRPRGEHNRLWSSLTAR
jgi:hypothetical protein